MRSGHKEKLKLVAIVGPTASGKSGLAVGLARRFNGVVLSADSRQVYKGLDTATGKITRPEMDGVPHYLLNIVPVGAEFNVTIYQQMAYALIDKLKGKKMPILAGGTGLYVSAVCDGYQFTDVLPDPALRAKLEKATLPALQKQLLKLDPETTVDLKNPRRVIRAIEIAKGRTLQKPSKHARYDVLKIGIHVPLPQLEKNIRKRIAGMDMKKLFREARLLAKLGDANYNPLFIYYRPAMDFLSGKIGETELTEQMVRGDLQYAKRQMTWFKKDSQIHWVSTLKEAKKLIFIHISHKT